VTEPVVVALSSTLLTVELLAYIMGVLVTV